MIKRAQEEIFYLHEFKRADGRGWLTEGETIATATVTITDIVTGEDVSTAMISEAAPYNNTSVRYKLSGGTVGSEYRLDILITTTTGQIFKDVINAEII